MGWFGSEGKREIHIPLEIMFLVFDRANKLLQNLSIKKGYYFAVLKLFILVYKFLPVLVIARFIIVV